MDDNSKQMLQDCFLRPIVNPRGTNTKTEPTLSKVQLKTELQILRLNEESQKMIIETLQYIHGHGFSLGNKSEYTDLGNKIKNKYWTDRGNLVIQGGYDYSLSKTGSTTEDRFRMFSITKLESYGFAKSHCIEALEHCNDDIYKSFELLHSKYFPCDKLSEHYNYSEDELNELRIDEKSALESIYDKLFEEKELHHIWQLKFKIDHLLIYSPSQQKKLTIVKNENEKQNNVKTNLCRNFQKNGKCQYSNKCRFLHETPVDILNNNRSDSDPNLDSNWFYLEIRFPKGNSYPYEPPIICLKTTCPDIPHNICLSLTKRLIEEATELTQYGMPCVYTLIEFLQNDANISDYLKTTSVAFLDPQKSIFYVASENSIQIEKKLGKLETHYKKGTTGKNDAMPFRLDQKLQENQAMIDNFIKKQNNPNYKHFLKIRSELPAWQMMETILTTIKNNPVVVISGETGCGKSTQIPQFILDDWLLEASSSRSNNNIGHVEIICTQPRRLSAIGVAERVSEERNERVGNTVGYSIRLENKISSSTRLTFCTTGILIRRLQSDPLLEYVSHIIVDEVHERSEESDFLLLILKELIIKRPELKVVLMSATLNSKLFSNYLNDAPILEIPGRTFPVEQIFLEDILEKTNFILESDSQYCRKLKKTEQQLLFDELEYSDIKSSKAIPSVSIRDENLSISDIYSRYSEYSKVTCKSLFLMDPLKINPELIESILNYIIYGQHDWPKVGSILIFLPGFAEIKTMYDWLTDSAEFNPRSNKYVLVPLHSTLTNEEQALVFKKPPNGKRKIVLSTNIAETSVTIDDCVFVIDSGQMKEKRFDPNRNMESLDLVWVSRANAMQRKGRAGRVMPGISIHLFTQHRFTYHMLNQPVPEIHRVPLEQLLLRIKILPTLQDRQIANVMSSIIEPPNLDSISSAIVRLQDVGAFDLEEGLTPLGHHLSALPVDIRIGKLMLFGAIFQCVDSVLTIAACLSFKSPFVSPFNKKNEADTKKQQLAICNSDHLTVLRAYKRWQEAFKKSRFAGKCFAEENYLSVKTLETIVEIKYQFLELLISIGFVPIDLPRRRIIKDDILELTGIELNKNGDNHRLLAALLCGALYPNVVKVLTPEKSFTMSAGGAVPKLPQSSDLKFKTRDDGYVHIHPSSVNSIVGNFLSPYLVFQEKVKTSRIYIRECTMIPLLPLVLFSGSDFKIELHGGDFTLLLENGWIILQAHTFEIAEMMKWLRIELAKLLEEKINDPCLNLVNHENGNKIISTIVYLISRE